MPDYRRAWHPSGTYFFTVNLLQRKNNRDLRGRSPFLPFSTTYPGLLLNRQADVGLATSGNAKTSARRTYLAM